jgi:hypothetical protein
MPQRTAQANNLNAPNAQSICDAGSPAADTSGLLMPFAKADE